MGTKENSYGHALLKKSVTPSYENSVPRTYTPPKKNWICAPVSNVSCVMPNPKTNSESLNREYSIIITQYMTSDIHLTGTTHCRKGCLLHNNTLHERKIGKQNMTAKGTRNTTDNILVHIQTLRYTLMLKHSSMHE